MKKEKNLKHSENQRKFWDSPEGQETRNKMSEARVILHKEYGRVMGEFIHEGRKAYRERIERLRIIEGLDNAHS